MYNIYIFIMSGISKKNNKTTFRKSTKKYKSKKNNNKNKKKTLKISKGGHIVMYRIYDSDDNTINKQTNRCYCIDYKFNKKGEFSTKSNPGLYRCKRKAVDGTNFCKLHMNCKSYLNKFVSGDEYDYEPNKWKIPEIEGSHNCYSYFLTDRVPAVAEKCMELCLKKHKKGCPLEHRECGDLIPQPGDYHLLKKYGDLSKKKRTYNCKTMEEKIFSDNKDLKHAKFNEKCPSGHYKGAMVVDRDHTFHFYKQNKDAMWSHKPGVLPITLLDADKKPIYIPHFSNRNYSTNDGEDEINYKDFCGYYCIPKKNIMGTNSV